MGYQSVVQTILCTHCLLQEHLHNDIDHSRCVCVAAELGSFVLVLRKSYYCPF